MWLEHPESNSIAPRLCDPIIAVSYVSAISLKSKNGAADVVSRVNGVFIELFVYVVFGDISIAAHDDSGTSSI
jgi:hypothetical protein